MKFAENWLSARKIRSIVILIFVIAGHLALDLLYRPFARAHSVMDLGFKDSFTQITSVIGISLLMVILEKEETWNGRTGRWFLIIVPVAAMLVYELIQIFIPASHFDPQDILYTLLGGILIYVIQLKVIR